jgi:RNA polymerase-binding transcription factor
MAGKDMARKETPRKELPRKEKETAKKEAAPPPSERTPPESESASTNKEMTKALLKKFKQLLEQKREDIIRRAQQTLSEDMTLDSNELPDEMDLASTEYLQSFTFRLRGREKSFLKKIQRALDKIEDGSFGLCEECEQPIQIKRLEARPETSLCIKCKEEQEREERDFAD